MMSKKINFMMFILGAAVGSIVTWRYIEKKYEQIAQEEIDSVKEVFSKREMDFVEETEDVDVRTKADNAKEKPSVVEYAARLREQGYTNYSDIDTENKEEVEKESMAVDKPYVIAPEEFGEFDDYEKISLTYYADHILADDNDEMVDDIDDVVGFDSLNSFGEYEDDSVFVRNDRLRCDYEILLDQRKFMSIRKRKPHEVND
ncbi:MAG: hypothetical protein WC383_14350 [Gammaproteobacteria bacterium]|jgi:hypothetical protein